MGNYVPFSKITTIGLGMILRIWKYSGLVLVFCFLIYYLYGCIPAIALLFFAVTGMLYQLQDALLFSPELPSHSRVYVPIPSEFNLPYENITVETIDKVKIHMYFIGQPKDRQRHSPTLIFFHGNAGNMGHRLQNCAGLYHNLHCNILLVEYRGYGLSEGTPSEEGLYLDARASIDYLFQRNDINHSEIIVFGRSLGGAVAIDLACREEYASKIWCLVLENTFTSIPRMAKVILGFRILKYFPLFFFKNKFLSYQKVRQLRIPTLFISGMADVLVPPRMMRDLHDRCSSIRKQLLEIPTGSHNDTWQAPAYYHSLAVFLQSCRFKNHISNPIETNNAETKTGKDHLWVNVQTI